jgi:hypothetical protein
MVLTRLLDVVALVSALVAAWLWYRASSNVVRRVEKGEELDHRDLNRIVVTINRSQILNRRAALATAVSALAFAAKMAKDMLAAALGS